MFVVTIEIWGNFKYVRVTLTYPISLKRNPRVTQSNSYFGVTLKAIGPYIEDVSNLICK